MSTNKVFFIIKNTTKVSPMAPPSSSKKFMKKPKRNRSAFIIFSSETRKRNEEIYKGLYSNNIMTEIAISWNNLSQVEREKYIQEAKKEKERYQRELKAYQELHSGKLILNKTEKNHVKKPCSAYALFLQDMKKQIKKKNQEITMAEVLKIVAAKWKKLTEDDKKPYQEKAKKEKEVARLKKEKLENGLKNKTELSSNSVILNPKRPFKIVKTDPMRQVETTSREVSDFINEESTPQTYDEQSLISPPMNSPDSEILDAMEQLFALKDNNQSSHSDSPLRLDSNFLFEFADDYDEKSKEEEVLDLLNFDCKLKSSLSFLFKHEQSGVMMSITPKALLQNHQRSSRSEVFNDLIISVLPQNEDIFFSQ